MQADTMTDPSLTKFQELLRRLFQFDAADLDFGIYRILNAKRQQVEEFLDTRLPAIVEESFAAMSDVDHAEAAKELNQLRTTLTEKAFDADGELLAPIAGIPLGQQYLAAKAKLERATIGESLKHRVYNDLYTFFNRYYEDGDFISKRRRGRDETYSLPYNGEEVLLHWANKDQYYIKSDEQLAAYRFKTGDTTIHFEIRSAQAEANNNKTDKRFYVLAASDAVSWDAAKKALTLYFDHRALTAAEQETFGKNGKAQAAIHEATEKTVLGAGLTPEAKAALAAPLKDTTVLRHHLNQFARRNTADFFVHKDLGGFLNRELDFFIKNEALLLDELLGGDEATLTGNLLRARVTRSVAEKIIVFLAQVEDFQKKLFEKRKFVLATHYAVTVDRVPETLWETILGNAAQVAEWQALFGLDELLKADGLLGGTLDVEALRRYPALVVDTRHFDEDFKASLLASFDDLDAAIDGVLFNSENFQALALLQEKYRGQVKCIYIDPPYNTGGDGFLYKDAYQHSSWLSMMAERLTQARELLPEDGSIFINIDDDEQATLKRLLDIVFGQENFVANIIWQKKVSPSNDAKYYSSDHDYILNYAKDKNIWRPYRLEMNESQKANYKNPDNDPRGPWNSVAYTCNKSKSERENLYYEVTNPNTGESTYPKETAVWKYSPDEHKVHIKKEMLYWGKDGTSKAPRLKLFFSDEMRVVPRSIWLGTEVGNTQEATAELQELLPSTSFTSPKARRLVERVISVGSRPKDYILDFFAGSGTTGHAVISMNRDDINPRKYLLCEMGGYFGSVLLPRVKKSIFASQWSDGKPVSRDGASQLVKYHVLEQYEDTLNNIEVKLDGDGGLAAALFGDDYILRYLLDLETRGSASLLNLEKLDDPFNYKLKVKNGDGLVERPVDLVETFAYLLGLTVRKVRSFTDSEAAGRRYKALLGEKDGKTSVTVWREAKTLEGSQDGLLRDRVFVKETILPALLDVGQAPARLLLNGAFAMDGGEAIEPEFYRLMFAEVIA